LITLRCATTNPGKLREFRAAAAHFGQGNIAIEPVQGLGGLPAPVEDGQTFEENAVKKALHYSAYAEEPVFADDSGLEVDALGGAPGVYSARFAGEGATDAANNQLLVERLRGVEDRTARFVCVVALARAGELLGVFRGSVEGRIVDEPSGPHGFGYDPHFFYPPFAATFGATEPARKMDVSHRGQALRAMLAWAEAHL
jgi:XTP/dITP diphosphohydrolase